jgi:hypothetical protein
MRLFYNVGYQRSLPDQDVLDGVVAHTAAVDSARPTAELAFSGEILFDPNVYLWGLDCEDAARTCAYIATYPWSTIEVPTLDAFDGKRREWINLGVLPAMETHWPPSIPADLKKMVHACLQWQYDAGATILIAPAPLITQVHEGLTEYARWLAAAASQATQFDRPVFMTVAFSEVCFPQVQEGLLDLLSADMSLDGSYVVMETTHTSPYVASPGLAEALLEISYHLGHRQGREVIINYADTFGLACLAAGATGIVAGYGLKYRRFSLSDYSGGGGGPYPRFASLRTFCRYLASADMERIRDEDLLSEFDSDTTPASKSLLQALSSGKSANDVLRWETERNRTAAAKAHYVQRLRRAVDEITSLDNVKSRVGRMQKLMLRADSMNSLLRETFNDEPLDEDGAHVRLWRHALSNFARRYAGE